RRSWEGSGAAAACAEGEASAEECERAGGGDHVEVVPAHGVALVAADEEADAVGHGEGGGRAAGQVPVGGREVGGAAGVEVEQRDIEDAVGIEIEGDVLAVPVVEGEVGPSGAGRLVV